jgi:hypothetical protein
MAVFQLDHVRMNELRCWEKKSTKTDLVTIIEIKPHRWGGKDFESPGVEPDFQEKQDAIDYAQTRACFRSGEIHVFDSTGTLERTIPFNEAD